MFALVWVWDCFFGPPYISDQLAHLRSTLAGLEHLVGFPRSMYT